jgi:hypothetical protein
MGGGGEGSRETRPGQSVEGYRKGLWWSGTLLMVEHVFAWTRIEWWGRPEGEHPTMGPTALELTVTRKRTTDG